MCVLFSKIAANKLYLWGQSSAHILSDFIFYPAVFVTIEVTSLPTSLWNLVKINSQNSSGWDGKTDS